MCAFVLFFLVMRRPSSSSLFPYTDALPISLILKSDGIFENHNRQILRFFAESARIPMVQPELSQILQKSGESRSEEHTSELQSHHDLVCRLLLEKKKFTLAPGPLKRISMRY